MDFDDPAAYLQAIDAWISFLLAYRASLLSGGALEPRKLVGLGSTLKRDRPERRPRR